MRKSLSEICSIYSSKLNIMRELVIHCIQLTNARCKDSQKNADRVNMPITKITLLKFNVHQSRLSSLRID